MRTMKRMIQEEKQKAGKVDTDGNVEGLWNVERNLGEDLTCGQTIIIPRESLHLS